MYVFERQYYIILDKLDKGLYDTRKGALSKSYATDMKKLYSTDDLNAHMIADIVCRATLRAYVLAEYAKDIEKRLEKFETIFKETYAQTMNTLTSDEWSVLSKSDKQRIYNQTHRAALDDTISRDKTLDLKSDYYRTIISKAVEDAFNVSKCNGTYNQYVQMIERAIAAGKGII